MKTSLFLNLMISMLFLFFGAACGRFSPLPDGQTKDKATSSPTAKDQITPGQDSKDGTEEPEVPLKGAPLSEMALLHKLSMSLRGWAPTTAEYQSYRDALTQKKGEEHLSQKTQEYIHTTAFVERMVLKLDELFYLKSTPVRPLLVPRSDAIANFQESIQYSATENVFRDLFLKNLNWDALLKGKSYRLPIYGEDVPEMSFFKDVLGQPLDFSFNDNVANQITPDSYQDISFDPQDSRIAGVITSPRFFQRYSATGLNKNRRRAAAIFRTFLCDPMISTIPESHDSKTLVDLIFPGGSTVTESQIIMPMDALHGTQPDCMSCHYKLDPLGRSLLKSPVVLHEEPSAGALVFTNAKGALVNRPARGVGEIAQLISEQPEYVNCQVDHFWNWFIGSDVPLGKKARSEVVQSFEQLGRRSNDFVAYLVSRPEFRIRVSKDPQRAMVVEVKNFLKRCDSCHDGMRMNSQMKVPRFAEWPIGNGSQASDWLNRISKSLDLGHQGKARTMPTKEGFKPTLEELNNIQRWIEQGAPNESGQKMVKP